MENSQNHTTNQIEWSILVGAARRAIEEDGLTPTRVPGRGRSNIWEVKRDGEVRRVSIRTTNDRWFAFPPLKRGTKWKTLDDVDVVVVAAVDDRDDPKAIEVYRFEAAEVRSRFDAAYAARTKAGLAVKDNFGMWVNLDQDTRRLPASIGSGLASTHRPIAVYPIDAVVAVDVGEEEPESEEDGLASADTEQSAQPQTMADVMEWARRRIASLAGVRPEAVKLDLKIEY